MLVDGLAAADVVEFAMARLVACVDASNPIRLGSLNSTLTITFDNVNI